MTQPDSTPRYTYAAYLAAERLSDTRHEFSDGRVWAMAGGTPEHGALAIAFGGELRAALRGKPCRVFSSDVRVRVRETGLATYPDLSVVCGELLTDPEDPDAIINPRVIIEVLSASTEAHDRGAKAAHYRRSATLQEYVLVAQHPQGVEVQRRNEKGRWEIIEVPLGTPLELTSLGVTLDLSAVYANPLAEGTSP